MSRASVRPDTPETPESVEPIGSASGADRSNADGAAATAPAPAPDPPPDDVSRGTAILVPLDGSLTAEAILPFVVKIAAPLRLKVALLRVLPPPAQAGEAPTPDTAATPTAFEEAEVYLQLVAAGLEQRGVDTAALVRTGDPAAHIVQLTEELHIDLIAMTTHGGADAERAPYGSIPEEVLRRVHIPVLLLRVREVSETAQAA